MNLHQTLVQWVNNHWSPYPPASYRVVHKGVLRPVGLIFSQRVAEFNLAWALAGGQIETAADANFVSFQMDVWKPILDEVVEDYPLREWLSMMPPDRFDQWLSRPQVDRSVRKMLRPTVRKAIQLQDRVHV